MPTNIFGLKKERSQPCRDLAARVEVSSPGKIIDLGCGPGNSTAILADRWPMAVCLGLDSSQAMIQAARKQRAAGQWIVGDIAAWAQGDSEPFDVVFSNAALQWVDDHAVLMPRLLKHVSPGGALAVQMPGNFDVPAHCAMRELAATAAWRKHLPPGAVREWHVHDLPFYYDTLAPDAARLDLWETEYLHVMMGARRLCNGIRGPAFARSSTLSGPICFARNSPPNCWRRFVSYILHGRMDACCSHFAGCSWSRMQGHDRLMPMLADAGDFLIFTRAAATRQEDVSNSCSISTTEGRKPQAAKSFRAGSLSEATSRRTCGTPI